MSKLIITTTLCLSLFSLNAIASYTSNQNQGNSTDSSFNTGTGDTGATENFSAGDNGYVPMTGAEDNTSSTGQNNSEGSYSPGTN